MKVDHPAWIILCMSPNNKKKHYYIKCFLSPSHQKDTSAEPVSCCLPVSIHLLPKMKEEELVLEKSIIPLARVLAGPRWDIISTAGADTACLLICVVHYRSRDSIPSAGKHRGVQQTQRVRLHLCCNTDAEAVRFMQPHAKISLRKQLSLKSFCRQTCHWQQWAELMRWLLIRQEKQICSYYLPCLQRWKEKRDSEAVLICWKQEQLH